MLPEPLAMRRRTLLWAHPVASQIRQLRSEYHRVSDLDRRAWILRELDTLRILLPAAVEQQLAEEGYL